jgi:hypothetical protein
VACSLKDAVVKDGGYFCTGKFELVRDMMLGEPYAAFVVAFADFTKNQVVARGAKQGNQRSNSYGSQGSYRNTKFVCGS